jgi:hypothetical protein
VDEIRISPAGDGFYAAAKHHPASPEATEETPHACYDGFVYMGLVDEDDEDEQIERVPCRRCRPESL